ncbi:MAG: outer membrane beta-barrel protein [Alteromonadaceae bacterium]|nr:outer membrane beta-barrel protein [Alteromonadaceae bacterium]
MKKSLLAIVIAGTMINSAFAVEPAGVNLDNGVVITPLLDTGFKHNDNIFSLPSNEQGSSIFTVAPSVNFLLDDGVNQFNVDLGIVSGTFLQSSNDNYLDGTFGAAAHIEPSSKQRFDIAANANWLTEARGTGITEGLGDQVNAPLLYAEQSVDFGYEYGSLNTPARISFEVKYYNKNYSNFKPITLFRDYDSLKFGSTFYYNTQAATDLFIEVSRDAIKYDNVETGVSSRDSDDYRALAGIKWEATALTTGSIKLGYQQKDFIAANRGNFNGLSWQADIQWQPLSYTTIAFNTSRAARDPSVEGNYINETVNSLSWQHDWSEKLNTVVSGSYINEDYSGVTRKDDTKLFSLSLNYALLRWVDVSLYADITRKDSTRANILFDTNIVGVNFTFSM